MSFLSSFSIFFNDTHCRICEVRKNYEAMQFDVEGYLDRIASCKQENLDLKEKIAALEKEKESLENEVKLLNFQHSNKSILIDLLRKQNVKYRRLVKGAIYEFDMPPEYKRDLIRLVSLIERDFED